MQNKFILKLNLSKVLILSLINLTTLKIISSITSNVTLIPTLSNYKSISNITLHANIILTTTLALFINQIPRKIFRINTNTNIKSKS